MRVSAPPNSSTSCSTSAGSSDVSTSCAISADRSGDGTSRRNASSSAGPDSPGSARGIDEHDAPLLGHRVVRQQRRGALDVAPHAALDHEAPERERPRPHRRARRAADRLGQLRRVDRSIVERRQRLRDRERELRARPQPDVRRDRLDHAQVRAAREAQRVPAAAREAQRAVGVGALGGQLVGRPRLDHDRRPVDRHPEPAEAPRRRRRPPRASRGAAAPAPRRAPRSQALPPPRAGGSVT